jgi:hypothetical protein
MFTSYVHCVYSDLLSFFKEFVNNITILLILDKVFSYDSMKYPKELPIASNTTLFHNSKGKLLVVLLI